MLRQRKRPGLAGRSQDAPFFPADSVIRRVHREGVVLLGGGRALLMQVAHPAVAAGVARHSSFRQSKRRRLLRTLRPTLAIVFGSDAQARDAASRVNAVHSHVVGPGYRADDPGLLFWVLATLIDTALLMHSLLLEALSAEDGEAYYRDMLRAGELLGVRPESAPASLADFRRYMAGMIETLEVGADALAISRDLFSGGGLTGPGGWLLRQWTGALLPDPLARQYALGSSSLGRTAGRISVAAAAAIVPRLPPALRRTPSILLPDRPSEA